MMKAIEMTWALGWVLPNIQIQEALNAEYVALVPFNDPRLAALARAKPGLNKFLSRFTDAFHAEIPPSVILVRTDAPQKLDNEAVASFRDLIALSIIPYSQAQTLVSGGGPRIMFSDSLWLYPWTPAIDDDEHLVVGSLSQKNFHLISAFHGQTNPDVSPININKVDVDEPLFGELVKRWNRRYSQAQPDVADVKLFRSLNMANVALQIPATVDATYLDIGRTIAIWVSAFEILAHPGTKGKHDLLRLVCSNLKKVSLRDPKVSAAQYGDKQQKLPLPTWIYEQLYLTRNKFLHGNPVAEVDLMLKGTAMFLSRLAAPLYRLALSGFLPLTFTTPNFSSASVSSEVCDRLHFNEFQEIIERALLRAFN